MNSELRNLIILPILRDAKNETESGTLNGTLIGTISDTHIGTVNGIKQKNMGDGNE